MEGKPLALAVLLAGAIAIGVGVFVLHSASAPQATPERPRPPPPVSMMVNSDMRFSPVYYRTQLEQDAKAFGIPAPAWDDITQPNPYFDELKEKQHLRIKAPIETRHLRVSLEIGKIASVLEGQTMGADHLILRIENRTPLYLAYRIQTSVAEKRKCANKGEIPHNAVAIAPNQTIMRTECLYRRDEAVDVNRIEVVEMPALSAYYVSRLPPNATLYDPRTFSGHVGFRGHDGCQQTFSWREIKEGVDQKQFEWRDVIDFYSRHNCSEYSFFKTYRYRTDTNAPLPARPLD
ncbi:MAG TPA: hypothetical protein VJ860_16990 [Polyangia bacterium]|nr:hypothetical protein [Polyangia bacterium]